MSGAFVGQLDATAAKNISRFQVELAAVEDAVSCAIAHLARLIERASATLNATDRRHLSAVACASHIAQLTHSCLVLMRVGHVTSATIVARTGLESLFALRGLAEDRHFEEGQDFFLRLRYKAVSAQKRDKEEYIRGNEKLTDESRQRLMDAIADDERFLDAIREHRLTKIRELARLVDLEDAYIREYAFFSRSAHADLDGIVNDHISFKDGKTHINAIVFNQSHAEEAAAHLILLIMESVVSLRTLFALDSTSEEQAIEDKLARFYGESIMRSIGEPLRADAGAEEDN